MLRRLGAYAAFATLVLAVALTYSVAAWNRVNADEQRDMQAMVTVGAQAVETYYSTLEKALAGLAEDLRTKGINSATPESLKRFKARFSEFQIVAVTMMDGRNVASSESETVGDGPDVSAQPSFIDARERLAAGDAMVVSRPFFGSVTQAWLTYLRYGVRDAEGRLLFMLVAGLPLDRTQSLWLDAPLPAGAALGLMRDDFFVVARHPPPPKGSDDFFRRAQVGPLVTYLASHGLERVGMTRGVSPTTQREAFFAFRRLAHYPLTFYINNPAENFWAEWRAVTMPAYFLLAILLVSGVAVTEWVVRQQRGWDRERNARMRDLEQLAATLEKSNAELEEANADLDSFSYTVSHDLRAPLRAIDGFSALLASELRLEEGSEAWRLLSRVRAGSQHMSQLVERLLELARFGRVEIVRSNVDMVGLVREIFREIDAARRTTFEVEAMPSAFADPLLMRQVWGNLIGNAVKYSARADSPRVVVGWRDGAYFVQDNGAGFDMEHASQLFKPFCRLHSAEEYAGTGAGLAIVKRILDRHGGRIWAQSTPGGGARFSFQVGPCAV